MFAHPVPIETGITVERDGFVFTDLTADYPQRIVCLTEETTETLYLLGQGDRVVGVSGYTVRPPEARQKPKVSAFINARFDKIRRCSRIWSWRSPTCRRISRAELVGAACTVVTFNQRTVAEILQMIRDARRPRRLSATRPKRWPIGSGADLDRIRAKRRVCRDGRACSSRSGTSR